MPQNNYTSITITSIGFLTIGMLILSFKLYKTSRQNESLKDRLYLETTLHQNQISEILKRYDSLKDDLKTEAESKAEIKNNNTKPIWKDLNPSDRTVRVPNKLKAVNVNARGVRLIGKDVIETNQSAQIDQVRVCFTLESNKDIVIGQKEIGIQILNPKNRSINLKGHPGKKLDKGIYYDRLDTDVCVFVDMYQHELIIGEYKINLICDNRTIGSTVLKVN